MTMIGLSFPQTLRFRQVPPPFEKQRESPIAKKTDSVRFCGWLMLFGPFPNNEASMILGAGKSRPEDSLLAEAGGDLYRGQCIPYC
jgi:hypothetical protein